MVGRERGRKERENDAREGEEKNTEGIGGLKGKREVDRSRGKIYIIRKQNNKNTI